MKTVRKSLIKLTKKEFDFVTREDYPKIKQQIIQKVCQHFDGLGVLLQESLSTKNENVLLEMHQAQYKTTRGENYKLLPYVVLDYPRIKGPDFIFACRTMFWWGNYFSLNILLRTSSFDVPKLAKLLHQKVFNKVKLYTGNDLWQQDLSDPDFIYLAELTKSALLKHLNNKAYIKLSIKVPLKKWDELDKKAIKFYNNMLNGIS